MHKDYIGDILRKAYVYNDSMQQELGRLSLPDGKSLLDTKKDVVEFILGNYVTPKNFSKRPLAKLTHDMARELKLID